MHSAVGFPLVDDWRHPDLLDFCLPQEGDFRPVVAVADTFRICFAEHYRGKNVSYLFGHYPIFILRRSGQGVLRQSAVISHCLSIALYGAEF